MRVSDINSSFTYEMLLSKNPDAFLESLQSAFQQVSNNDEGSQVADWLAESAKSPNARKDFLDSGCWNLLMELHKTSICEPSDDVFVINTLRAMANLCFDHGTIDP